MRYLFFLLVFISITACQKDKPKKELPKDHLSEEFLAEFQGTLPCQDCEGIKTRVALQPERRFEIKMKYIGKSDSIYQYKGQYYYDESDQLLMINMDDEMQYFEVNPEYLKKLNENAKPIQSDNEEKYLLIRRSSN